MHGIDGWKMADFDWDPTTGLAKITYEREPGERTPDRRASLGRNGLETISVQVPQPTSPRHAGWSSDPHVRAFIDRDREFPTRHRT